MTPKSLLLHTLQGMCLAVILAHASVARAQDKLILFMTEIPGQTMLDEDEPGMALEIMRAAAGMENLSVDERFVPWTRAVNEVRNSANSLIIPFSRTPEREDTFTWISLLYPLEFGFISLGQAVDDLEAARRLDRIGVWRGSSMETFLKKEGFTDLVAVSNDQTLLRMLSAGRFDAWYGSLTEGAYKFRDIQLANGLPIRYGKPVASSPVWLAGGLQLPSDISERLRKAMAALQDNGTIAEIIAKYGRPTAQ